MATIYFDFGPYWRERGLPAQYCYEVRPDELPFTRNLRALQLADFVIRASGGELTWAKNRQHGKLGPLTESEIKARSFQLIGSIQI